MSGTRICPRCMGAGHLPGGVRCPRCLGEGIIGKRRTAHEATA